MSDSLRDAPLPRHSPTPTPREQSYERLLSLLELAEKGSRELDYAIEDFLHPGTPGDAELPCDFGFIAGVRQRGYALEFTTSLDAALTLVPEGWFWRCGRTTSFAGWAFINKEFDDDRTEFSFTSRRDGTTPALALCIASLKARHAEPPK